MVVLNACALYLQMRYFAVRIISRRGCLSLGSLIREVYVVTQLFLIHDLFYAKVGWPWPEPVRQQQIGLVIHVC
jgi:hypothetical protein